MGLHVTLLRDLDGRFDEMMKVKKMCEKAKISYPKEVESYFKGFAEESEEYLRTELAEIEKPKGFLREWSEDACELMEFDVAKLPAGVKSIRVNYCH